MKFARALAALLSVWLGWPWFLSNLYRAGDSWLGLAGWTAALLLLSVFPLFGPRWRFLGYLGWGPGVVLSWLVSDKRGGLALTLVAIPLALAQTLWWEDSLARREFLFRCKAAQVRRGRLGYCPGWGWVDRRHRLNEVLSQLQAGRREIVHLFFGGPAGGYEMVVNYGGGGDLLEKLRVVQLLAERCEAEELALPWWTGARISAYNRDDLSSVYFTLFCSAYPDVVVDWPCQSGSGAEERWQREGRELVAGRVRTPWDSPPPDLPRYHELFRALERLKPEVEMQVRGPVPL